MTPTLTRPSGVPTDAWAEFLALRTAGLTARITPEGYQTVQALLRQYPALRELW
jgi:hypothetical protein